MRALCVCVEYVGRCFRNYEIMKEEDPVHSPWRVSGFRTLAILLGFCAMASGGKGCYAAEAASSSPGGGPAAGWKAADSLRMIAAQRAHQWRESEGVLDNNDFACAYTDNDQVVGRAGHHVADDWFQLVRTTPRAQWSCDLSARLSMWTTSARIKGLVSMFLGMGSYRPAGIVTDTLKAEWKLTFRRVAEKKVLDNPEEITTYSWRHMAPTLAQLLECRPEEMAALGDWQNKGPDGLPLLVSQICSFHQDQVFGVGSRIQVDEPAFLGGDPKRGAGRGS